MRLWMGIVWFLALALCACAPAGPGSPPRRDSTPYPDLGKAPELGETAWLNSAVPLRLADLRGKVVLLNMWTFGCVNCRNVLPSLRGWYDRYTAEGLVVIGNHYPEFAHEADLNNLKKALAELDVRYPVAVDTLGATWQAYDNRYWPTLYLIDKQGHMRYVHIGEGGYEQTEGAIQALLAEPSSEDWR